MIFGFYCGMAHCRWRIFVKNLRTQVPLLLHNVVVTPKDRGTWEWFTRKKLVKMAFHQELVGKILSSSYVTCQKVVTYSWTLAITRGDSPSLGTSSPTYGMVQNGRETFPRVANSGQARNVGCKSLTNWSYVTRGLMSLGTDVSQSQVTLEISPEWQFFPSDIGGT